MNTGKSTPSKVYPKKLLSTLAQLVVTFITASSLASAHGGHDPRLKLAVNDNEIRMETSLEALAFMVFDSNDDGILSVIEYDSQIIDIEAWLSDRLNLTNAAGTNIPAYFADAPIVDRAHLEKTDAIEFVKVLRRYKLETDSDGYALNIDLFEAGESPDLLYSRSGSLFSLFEFKVCIPKPSKLKKIRCYSPG